MSKPKKVIKRLKQAERQLEKTLDVLETVAEGNLSVLMVDRMGSTLHRVSTLTDHAKVRMEGIKKTVKKRVDEETPEEAAERKRK